MHFIFMNNLGYMPFIFINNLGFAHFIFINNLGFAHFIFINNMGLFLRFKVEIRCQFCNRCTAQFMGQIFPHHACLVHILYPYGGEVRIVIEIIMDFTNKKYRISQEMKREKASDNSILNSV